MMLLICTAAGFNTGKMQMYIEEKRRKVHCDTVTCMYRFFSLWNSLLSVCDIVKLVIKHFCFFGLSLFNSIAVSFTR